MMVIQTVGVFLYRMLASIAYNFFYIGQSGFFPSQIRALAMMLTAIPMRLSMVLIAPIQSVF